MKKNLVKYVLLLVLLQGSIVAVAQDGAVNTVKVWQAIAPEQTGNTLITRPAKDARLTVEYTDGLGRPVQTVVRQGSLETGSAAKDMVAPIVYDEYGRETNKYMPFPSIYDNGGIVANPVQQQGYSLQPLFSSQGEYQWFHSKNEFEPSPLNRVVKTMAPGNSWVGSSRGVTSTVGVNTQYDVVKRWRVTEGVSGAWATYSVMASPNSDYATGELIKTITTDEHGKQVVELKDKEGKTLLKKVQIDNYTNDLGGGSDYTGWLCTYYIYDDQNNLRCVIQPQAVEDIKYTWVLTSAQLDEQCFRYEYDHRGRMIRKKVPGAGEVRMVYDDLDRLVLTQDANLRAQQKWMYTTYDLFSRPVATGLLSDPSNYNNQAYHITAAASSTAYPNLGGYTTEELTKTFYDGYSWLASYGNPLPSSYNSSYNTYFQTPSMISWPYPQANTATSNYTGLTTGTRTKVLGTSTYLYTVSIYNDEGRVIQVYSTNITGGTDIATTQYSWSGQPLVTVQKQETAGTGAQTSVVVSQMTYDDLGRLAKTEKKASHSSVSSGAMPAYKTIAENEYDKLGQLRKKKLAPAFNSNAGLETLQYEYNVRGWMLGMNRAYTRDQDNGHYFGFDLGYDKAANVLINSQSYAGAQYNGNIAGMVWKSKGDGEKRKYDFAYDAANRLLKADFTQYTSSSFNQSAGVNYSMKMGDGSNYLSAYDANGNIKQMQHWGMNSTGSSPHIDNLGYAYQPGSNKLAKVTDGVAADYKLGDFKDGVNVSDDYSYDANGNLVSDENKKISSITYNHLNLPSVITITGKGTISYTYDAAGNKIKKEVAETGQPVKTTLYIGGVVYENNVLQFLAHEEGRIRLTTANGQPATVYDYMLKDHLGNVRAVLTEEQKQDIYPAATLESGTYNGGSTLGTEQLFYTIDNGKIVSKSSATGITDYQNQNNSGNPLNNNPYSNTTANSDKLYKLNGNDAQKTGLGITLKVMAGDRLDILGKSYYFQNNTGGSGANATLPLLDILNGLLGTPGGTVGAAGHGDITGSQLNNLPNTTGGISTLLNNQTTQSNGNAQVPKAFINYIFFDEQFRYVAGGFSQAGTNSVVKDHFSELQNLTASKNGYVYIYASNQSPVDVFFDNLQVVHTRSPLIEETHYYPFGLTMKGISAKALNGIAENKFKYNGKEEQWKEFSDGSGLESYDYHARMQDPQLGRFWQIDPKCEIFPHYNLYNYCFNNPLLFVDPDGMLAKYNWDDGKYYDEGKEVSWEEVQQQHKIGKYSETQSVLLTQPYEKDGTVRNDRKVVANDYGSGFLGYLIESAKATKGNITIIQATSANNAADQIEGLSFLIDNLIIGSHGTVAKRSRAYFSLGEDFLHTSTVMSSEALNRISKKMSVGSTVIVFACGSGGFYNGGDQLLKALAKKLSSIVYGPQGDSFGNKRVFGGAGIELQNTKIEVATHLKGVQGLWTMAKPNGTTNSIKNVYFDAFGRIHYELKQ